MPEAGWASASWAGASIRSATTAPSNVRLLFIGDLLTAGLMGAQLRRHLRHNFHLPVAAHEGNAGKTGIGFRMRVAMVFEDVDPFLCNRDSRGCPWRRGCQNRGDFSVSDDLQHQSTVR